MRISIVAQNPRKQLSIEILKSQLDFSQLGVLVELRLPQLEKKNKNSPKAT